MKENYAATKESWQKIEETYEERVNFIEIQFTLGLTANLGLPTWRAVTDLLQYVNNDLVFSDLKIHHLYISK